jgi:hypothetical protein
VTVRALALASFVALIAGCTPKAQVFQSEVQLGRVEIVHRDAKGKTVTLDVEVEWTQCPGEQREVIRGDATFADCMAKHSAGAKLPVVVDWQREPSGRWDWDILQIGECKRTPEGHDDSSFDMVQECETLKEHDEVVGFRCDRVPHKELLTKCPWFKRS